METNGFVCFYCLFLYSCSVISAPPGPHLHSSPPGEDSVLPLDHQVCRNPQEELTAEWFKIDDHAKTPVLVIRDGQELTREKDPMYKYKTSAEGRCCLKLLKVTEEDSGMYCVVLRNRSSEIYNKSFIFSIAARVRDEVTPTGNWFIAIMMDHGGVVTFVVLFIVAFVCFVVVGCYWPEKLGSFLRGLTEFIYRWRTKGEKVCEDIMGIETTGAHDTAKANGLNITGIAASKLLAEKDLSEMLKYQKVILRVGANRRIHPALIAGIISRQSRAGTDLRSDGFGKIDSNCFGLMQINKVYHAVKGDPFSETHVDQGVEYLCWLFGKIKDMKGGTMEQRLKGALASYISGVENVLSSKSADVDSLTPYHDFANDVIARAQWFAAKGFEVSGPV